MIGGMWKCQNHKASVLLTEVGESLQYPLLPPNRDIRGKKPKISWIHCNRALSLFLSPPKQKCPGGSSEGSASKGMMFREC